LLFIGVFVSCVRFACTCFVSSSFPRVLQSTNAWLLHHPLLCVMCVYVCLRAEERECDRRARVGEEAMV
jgi:hypothetical protein